MTVKKTFTKWIQKQTKSSLLSIQLNPKFKNFSLLQE